MNHVSQMYLYEQLQDALLLAASERGQQRSPRSPAFIVLKHSVLDFRDQQQRERLRPFNRYCETKLANALCNGSTASIDELSKNVREFLHPGGGYHLCA